jgi:hypothetical protein
MNRESEGKSSGIPHLAKNERDMGHPAVVFGLGRVGEEFNRPGNPFQARAKWEEDGHPVTWTRR